MDGTGTPRSIKITRVTFGHNSGGFEVAELASMRFIPFAILLTVKPCTVIGGYWRRLGGGGLSSP
jgi:hypothetical protein